MASDYQIVIKQGAQGPQGATGPQGPQGDPGTGVTVSATEPASPTIGDFWLDTNGDPDQLKIYETTGWEVVLYKSEAADPTNNITFDDGYF